MSILPAELENLYSLGRESSVVAIYLTSLVAEMKEFFIIIRAFKYLSDTQFHHTIIAVE